MYLNNRSVRQLVTLKRARATTGNLNVAHPVLRTSSARALATKEDKQMKKQAIVLIHVPLEAVRSGHSTTYGFEKFEVPQGLLEHLPADAGEELTRLIKAGEPFHDQAPDKWPPKALLELDSFVVTDELFTDALRYARAQRIDQEIQWWMAHPNSALVEKRGPFHEWFPRARVEELGKYPQGAELLERARLAVKQCVDERAEQGRKSQLASEGLRNYAVRVGHLTRAAQAGYKVEKAVHPGIAWVDTRDLKRRDRDRGHRSGSRSRS